MSVLGRNLPFDCDSLRPKKDSRRSCLDRRQFPVLSLRRAGVDVKTGHNKNWKNAMTMVFVDTTEIKDWQSFHQIFSQTFGFPAFYGNNMDALIDCLSYLDEPRPR